MAKGDNNNNNDNNDDERGQMIVEEAGRKGGNAPHEERGLQAADEETRERVARAGGEYSHGGHGGSKDSDNNNNDNNNGNRGRRSNNKDDNNDNDSNRGLAYADKETRERVAKKVENLPIEIKLDHRKKYQIQ